MNNPLNVFYTVYAYARHWTEKEEDKGVYCLTSFEVLATSSREAEENWREQYPGWELYRIESVYKQSTNKAGHTRKLSFTKKENLKWRM